jgi:hypothetical protein
MIRPPTEAAGGFEGQVDAAGEDSGLQAGLGDPLIGFGAAAAASSTWSGVAYDVSPTACVS